MNRSAIDLIPESRRSLLVFLKKKGWSTIPKLAQALRISTEGVRQQLIQLEKEGWVSSNCKTDEVNVPGRSRGRPATEYCLSASGDDLFPKEYADLTIAFFDELTDPVEALTALTDERVRNLEKSPKPIPEKLRSIYMDGDPYTWIEKSNDGYRLVESNCPFLQFATERPLFCSSTVSALRRLSGCEVVREKRFQDGDGRCVFHIDTTRPLSEAQRSVPFEQEPNPPNAKG